jgi:hypothetical protein
MRWYKPRIKKKNNLPMVMALSVPDQLPLNLDRI